jgi:hypothetical protein
MSAIDERVAYIRMFTVPGRPVEVLVVHQYAALAADWERLRLWVRHNPLPVLAEEERFAALSVTLQRLSTELGLRTCTAKTAGTEGISGITDSQGFLPNDPGHLLFSRWFEATEKWFRLTGSVGDSPAHPPPARSA